MRFVFLQKGNSLLFIKYKLVLWYLFIIFSSTFKFHLFLRVLKVAYSKTQFIKIEPFNGEPLMFFSSICCTPVLCCIWKCHCILKIRTCKQFGKKMSAVHNCICVIFPLLSLRFCYLKKILTIQLQIYKEAFKESVYINFLRCGLILFHLDVYTLVHTCMWLRRGKWLFWKMTV